MFSMVNNWEQGAYVGGEVVELLYPVEEDRCSLYEIPLSLSKRPREGRYDIFENNNLRLAYGPM